MNIEEIELCLDMHYQTEIVRTRPLVNELGDDLVSVRARGAGAAAYRQQYVRPMFEVMPVPIGAPFLVHQVPCADCGDFSRSWNCEAHTPPIGEEGDVPEEAGFRTAFSDGPVMNAIRLQAASPSSPSCWYAGLEDFSIDITEEGVVALNEALMTSPRRRMEPRDEN